jgi:hypothetical protein
MFNVALTFGSREFVRERSSAAEGRVGLKRILIAGAAIWAASWRENPPAS